MPGQPIPCRQWGADLDANALQQMENACKLPISVAAALMPDAHVGYGLPIGGVLATDNAVIPYAVGVDIACRVKLTVLDLPLDQLRRHETDLIRSIEAETRFGIGSEFKHRRTHPVMDEDWSVSPITQRFRDKAAAQLGTSGSGNHFVEFGEFTVENKELGLEPGTYLALLSHSGSRGTGAQVCDHYSRVARAKHKDLPKELSYLAWLDLDSADGQEYWAAMELMGLYASANHHLIHKHIARHLGAGVLLDIGEPPQLRVEGTPRRTRPHRSSQRRDAGGRGRAGRDSRFDGQPDICRARQGQRRVAQFRLPRRGPRDEPPPRRRKLSTGKWFSPTWTNAA